MNLGLVSWYLNLEGKAKWTSLVVALEEAMSTDCVRHL
jgi:hypothetical protein